MSDLWSATAPGDVAPVVDPTPVGGVRVVRRPRWRRRLGVSALALVLAGGAYYGFTFLQVRAVGSSDQARPVDAIVVMGAAQYDGTPSPQLQARLDHTFDLWSAGIAGTVVVTGGNQPGDRFTEADASADYLIGRGVPDAVILRETVAHTSYDSLAGVATMLHERGLQTVLLVSDPFHSLRIRLTAEELGLTAFVSPTRTSPVQGSAETRRELKEAVGVAVGRVIGFRRLVALTG